MRTTSSGWAPASTRAASVMSPATPAWQLNQATRAGTFELRPDSVILASPDDAGDRTGGAEPVVDADDRHAVGAGSVHREQCGHPLEGRAVADARRNGD